MAIDDTSSNGGDGMLNDQHFEMPQDAALENATNTIIAELSKKG